MALFHQHFSKQDLRVIVVILKLKFELLCASPAIIIVTPKFVLTSSGSSDNDDKPDSLR